MKKSIIPILIIISVFMGCVDDEMLLEPVFHKRPAIDPTWNSISYSQRDKLWHLFGEHGINVEDAWKITKGSRDVVISVVDNQFAPKHEAFNRCPWLYDHRKYFGVKKNSDKPYHGLSVASFISTCPNNSAALMGVNQISKVKWLEIGSINALDHMLWTADLAHMSRAPFSYRTNKPADVINASFSVDAIYSNEADDFQARNAQVINMINHKNIIVVAASGNGGKNAEEVYPASLPGVISVGATGPRGYAASFSNWGDTVEIMAPGDSIIPAGTNNSYTKVGGTSFSSPLLTGVISLMKSVYKELNWKTAIYFLQTTAKPMTCDEYCTSKHRVKCRKTCCPHGKQICTAGIVDAAKAVRAAKEAESLDLPKVALVDSMDYMIYLRPNSSGHLVGKTIIYNRGGSKGKYKLTSMKKGIYMKISPNTVELAAKGDAGDSKEVVITTRNFSGIAKVKINSLDGAKDNFSDEMTIWLRKKNNK